MNEPEPENYLARLEKLAADDSGLARLRAVFGKMDPSVVARLLGTAAEAGDDEIQRVLEQFQKARPTE
jgi:hypothetical protein